MGELHARGTQRRRIAAVSAVLTGCVAVAGSGAAIWVDVLGSELTGLRMAELIGDFGDEVDGVPSPWVGSAWYLFPAAAGLAWVLAVMKSPVAARRSHVWIGLAIMIAAGAYLVVQELHGGPILAFVGGLLILGGGMGRSGRPFNSEKPVSMGNHSEGSDI